MKKEKLAYMAGIVDGEGSIRIELQKGENRGVPDYYRLRISVANTDITLIQWLCDNFKGSSLKEKRRIGNRKQNYQWEVKAPKQVGFLVKILYPYLIVKRKQAEVALQVADLMQIRSHRATRLGYSSEERQKLKMLYERMKILNRKGLFTEPVEEITSEVSLV